MKRILFIIFAITTTLTGITAQTTSDDTEYTQLLNQYLDKFAKYSGVDINGQTKSSMDRVFAKVIAQAEDSTAMRHAVNDIVEHRMLPEIKNSIYQFFPQYVPLQDLKNFMSIMEDERYQQVTLHVFEASQKLKGPKLAKELFGNLKPAKDMDFSKLKNL